MDKKYNVDDILSEIKTRKSKERDGGMDAAEPTPTHHPEVEVEDIRISPGGPEEGESDESAEILFVEEEPAVATKPRNPMDFDGHVRSISDRAKLRGPRPGYRPPGERPLEEQTPYAKESFEFRPFQDGDEDLAEPDEVQREEPPVKLREPIDFQAFRAQGDDQGHTRVMPMMERDSRDEEEEDRENVTELPRHLQRLDDDFYDDDLEDEETEHSAIDFSEYNSFDDRRDVATDIARVKLWVFIRAVASSVIVFFLFWFALSGKYWFLGMPSFMWPVEETMRGYLVGCTVMTALLAFVNSSSVGGGLMSLFRMRANSDTLPTLALLMAIAQGVAAVVNPERVDPMALNLYFPIAGLSMLFNALGKMTMISRIQTNFRLIASDRPKKALMRVEKSDFCRDFFPDAITRPTIAYSVKAGFFTDFLGLSYSDKYDVGINRVVAPVCLLGSVIVGVVSFVLGRDIYAAISAVAAVLAISATLSMTFVENIPLGKLAKKLAPSGGMVSGNKAVEDFCDTEGIILTENDLFPAGCIRLRGIKTFSQGRIDESILDAASVICALGGALSPVFLEMIGGDKKLLKKADNIVYENEMGLSAWVDSRRVLIGNRQLMQNHGIPLPPEAEKAAVLNRAPEEGELLFLATSGEVTAQFAVSYHIDEELASQLDYLAGSGKDLIVYTNDANITPRRVWELYGYPEEQVHIMPAERHQEYRDMSEPRPSAIAEIVYTGKASAMVGAIIACINARSSILNATVVQLIQIILGYGLVAFMAFMGVIGSLGLLQLLIYQGFWFLVIFILQQFKQS